MPISNYPNGFLNGVVIRGVPILQLHPGKVFWVNGGSTLPDGGIAGDNSNGKGSYLQPYATIAYALTQCVANRGDIVAVMPGHTETVTSASQIDFTKAGSCVIGLGRGSNRPTINITNTAGFVDFSAANCTLMNILITGGVDAIVKTVLVDAADAAIIGCEIRDVTGQVTDGILTTANANRLYIKDLRYDGATAAGTNAGIAIVGGDRICIEGLRMDGNFAVGGIDVRTTATTDLEVRDVVFRTRNAADIFLVDTITASTGMIGPSLYLQLTDNAANITEAITGATFVQFDDIYVVNLAGEKAMLINTTASTDA
jgi:hypothetical protein